MRGRTTGSSNQGSVRQSADRGLGTRGLGTRGLEVVSSAQSLVPSQSQSQVPVRSPTPSPVQDDFAAMHEVVLRGMKLWSSVTFPTVLIDAVRSLSAAYAALEELGLANLLRGIAKKEG